MASGTPVIVYKSGEPYFGITFRGKYGMVYSNERELAGKINMLLCNCSVWQHLSQLGLKRALNYSFDAFTRKLKEILNSVN